MTTRGSWRNAANSARLLAHPRGQGRETDRDIRGDKSGQDGDVFPLEHPSEQSKAGIRRSDLSLQAPAASQIRCDTRPWMRGRAGRPPVQVHPWGPTGDHDSTGRSLLWPRELWWKDPTELKLDLMFEKFVLNRCDVVIAQSKGVRDYMVRFYGRGISRKIRLVPTGVDHEKFATKAKSSGDPGILFVGALSEVKGVGCLLKAFSKVQSEVPSSKLVLVGSGPNTDVAIRKGQASWRLNGSVQFSGAVRDDGKLLELLQRVGRGRPSFQRGRTDILHAPRRDELWKAAVISTNVPGGIPDVLADDAGILIEREDERRASPNKPHKAGDRYAATWLDFS